ncbi:MAG: hypothetical protein K1X33_08905 [Methanobacteriaceae archaeon]|nr:hypothetical protein [Methanobacteriaceae archaeon]
MANFVPNLNILSEDRWNIRDLGLLNIPRRNEVKSYNGALKFENLIKEAQRQMQTQ